MIESFLLLLLCQLVGQIIAATSAVPVPGPVLGMVLMFVLLVWRPGVMANVMPGADALLRVLGLLFVPAGAGVMLHVSLLEREWLPIVVALVVSTFLGMITTGIILEWLLRKGRLKSGQDAGVSRD